MDTKNNNYDHVLRALVVVLFMFCAGCSTLKNSIVYDEKKDKYSFELPVLEGDGEFIPKTKLKFAKEQHSGNGLNMQMRWKTNFLGS